MSTVATRTLLSLLIIFAFGQSSANNAFGNSNASAMQNMLGLKQGCRFCKLMSQLVRGRFRPSKTPKHCAIAKAVKSCESLVGVARQECESAAKSTTTKKETASLCHMGPFCNHFRSTEEGALDRNELIESICTSCKLVARCYLASTDTVLDLSTATSIVHSFCRKMTFWQKPDKCINYILEAIKRQANDTKQVMLNPTRICFLHGSCAATQGNSSLQALCGTETTTPKATI